MTRFAAANSGRASARDDPCLSPFDEAQRRKRHGSDAERIGPVADGEGLFQKPGQKPHHDERQKAGVSEQHMREQVGSAVSQGEIGDAGAGRRGVENAHARALSRGQFGCEQSLQQHRFQPHPGEHADPEEQHAPVLVVEQPAGDGADERAADRRHENDGRDLGGLFPAEPEWSEPDDIENEFGCESGKQHDIRGSWQVRRDDDGCNQRRHGQQGKGKAGRGVAPFRQRQGRVEQPAQQPQGEADGPSQKGSPGEHVRYSGGDAPNLAADAPAGRKAAKPQHDAEARDRHPRTFDSVQGHDGCMTEWLGNDGSEGMIPD